MSFDGVPVVDGVDLSVADGSVLAVLGPSGCGKSTLLRAVAGLEAPAAGSVLWDGGDLAGTPTHRRGFALMFQDGQLFDHLTVASNVGYARRLQGAGRRAVRAEVDDLLELVGLAGYADRLPRTLSGGERQRVALARSLAARPRLLLLDEPLSALDAELRARLATDLRRILTEAGTTALLVTHDQAEAYAVADRLALMRAGRVVQEGATADVWRAPADADAARFLGYDVVPAGPGAAAVLAAAGTGTSGARASGAVAVRSAAVVADPRGSGHVSGAGGGGLAGTVAEVRPTPDAVHLLVDVDEPATLGRLGAVAAPGVVPGVGERVALRVDPAGVAVLPERWS